MSEKFKCLIFCGKGTKRIIDRIYTLNNEYVDSKDASKLEFVKNYINLSGLIFEIRDLDILEKVKYNSEIRKYSSKFIKILEDKSDTITTEAAFKELIRKSINRNAIYKNTKKGFNISSLMFGIGGLAPTIGTPLLVISLGLTGGEKLVSDKAPDWYELGPNIEYISKLELMKKNIL